jgi:CO dehydrogenase/acetyl-CoA synthase epsilon subunit
MDKETLEQLNKIIQEESLKVVRNYAKSEGFTERKLTDNPIDALSMVNRRYVNMNGTVASRPTSSVATVGQKYFATDTNIPMTYDGSNWRNGVGSVVAAG